MLLWCGGGETQDKRREAHPVRRNKPVNSIPTSASRAANDLIMSRRRGALILIGYVVLVVGVTLIAAWMR